MDLPDLRILIVTGIYPPDIGGPANFTPEFSEFLTEKGHSVQILTLSDELNHPEESFCNVRRIKRIESAQKVYNLVFYVTKLSILALNTSAFRFVKQGFAKIQYERIWIGASKYWSQ